MEIKLVGSTYGLEEQWTTGDEQAGVGGNGSTYHG